MSSRYNQASKRAGSRSPGRSDQAVHNACWTASSASWWFRRIREAMAKRRSIRSRARASNASASPRAARATSSSSIVTPVRSDFDRLLVMGHVEASVFNAFEDRSSDRDGRHLDDLGGTVPGCPQVAHGGGPIRLRQLAPVRSPDQWMVRERGRRLATESGAQADLRCGLAQQVTATHDQVHVLAQIVHDDSESVCPVPVPVGEGRVAVVRDLVRARADESIHPTLRAAAEGDAQDRPIESTPPTVAGTARSVPATPVVVRPDLERLARAVAAVHEPVAAKTSQCRRVGGIVVRLADRAGVGTEAEPLEILE